MWSQEVADLAKVQEKKVRSKILKSTIFELHKLHTLLTFSIEKLRKKVILFLLIFTIFLLQHLHDKFSFVCRYLFLQCWIWVTAYNFQILHTFSSRSSEYIGRYVLFGLNLQIVYTVKTTLTNINKSQGIAECKCKVPKPLGLGFHFGNTDCRVFKREVQN